MRYHGLTKSSHRSVSTRDLQYVLRMCGIAHNEQSHGEKIGTRRIHEYCDSPKIGVLKEPMRYFLIFI